MKVVEKIEELYEKYVYCFFKYNLFILFNFKVNVLIYEEFIIYVIE